MIKAHSNTLLKTVGDEADRLGIDNGSAAAGITLWLETFSMLLIVRSRTLGATTRVLYLPILSLSSSNSSTFSFLFFFWESQRRPDRQERKKNHNRIALDPLQVSLVADQSSHEIKPGASVAQEEDAVIAESGDVLVAAFSKDDAAPPASSSSASSMSARVGGGSISQSSSAATGRAGTAPITVSAPLGQYLKSQRSKSKTVAKVNTPESAISPAAAAAAAAVVAGQVHVDQRAQLWESKEEKSFIPN